MRLERCPATARICVAAYGRGWSIETIARAFGRRTEEVHFLLHARGVKMRRKGRKSPLDEPGARRKLARMVGAGETRKAIAHEFGVSLGTVAGWLRPRKEDA